MGRSVAAGGQGGKGKPVDPFAPIANTWSPPPLRYPKGRIKLEDLKQPKKKADAPIFGRQESGLKVKQADSKQPEHQIFGQYSQARQEANAYERGYESPEPPSTYRSESQIFEEQRLAEAERISNLQRLVHAFVDDKDLRPTYESEAPINDEPEEHVHLEAMRECIRKASSGELWLALPCSWLNKSVIHPD